MSERFGELRSVLHGAEQPSRAQWSRLCRLIDTVEPLDEATLSYAAGLLAHWPASLRVAPQRWWRVLLEGAPCPQLALARTLHLVGPHLDDADLARVLAAPELDVVAALTIARQGLGARCAEVLAQPGRFGALRRLELSQVYPQLELWQALGSGALFPALEHLVLRNVYADPAKLEALCQGAAGAPSWRALDLGGNRGLASALEPLCTSSHREHLEVLALWGCELGNAASAALLDVPWPALRALDLRYNAIDAELAHTVSMLGGLPSLRELRLSGNALGDVGLTALLTGLRAEALERLELAQCDLGDGALSALRLCTALTELDLRHNAELGEGLAELVSLPRLCRVMLNGTAAASGVAELVGDQLPGCRVIT